MLLTWCVRPSDYWLGVDASCSDCKSHVQLSRSCDACPAHSCRVKQLISHGDSRSACVLLLQQVAGSARVLCEAQLQRGAHMAQHSAVALAPAKITAARGDNTVSMNATMGVTSKGREFQVSILLITRFKSQYYSVISDGTQPALRAGRLTEWPMVDIGTDVMLNSSIQRTVFHSFGAPQRHIGLQAKLQGRGGTP